MAANEFGWVEVGCPRNERHCRAREEPTAGHLEESLPKAERAGVGRRAGGVARDLDPVEFMGVVEFF